jgi:hypothetical protein
VAPETEKHPVYFKLPDGYWEWPESKQRAWARQAAVAVQARLKPPAKDQPSRR